MRLGYNTNGFAFHRWQDALEILAEIGYRSVALTVDHFLLNPFAAGLSQEVDAMRRALEQHGMSCVIETGARYLLDPRRKHEPTLLALDEAGRAKRVDFLTRCVDLAVELQAEAVSFWSGAKPDHLAEDQAWDYLIAGCRQLADVAAERKIPLAFEPEPGMLVETMDQYRRLAQRVDSEWFGLTLDIGHLQCVETEPIARHLQEWSERIFNIHIEDMRRGRHEHLAFGEGEIDFAVVMSTLQQIDYTRGVHVELSRHSHMAPEIAAVSYRFLKSYLNDNGGSSRRDT